jgi:OFA family oxalate/formate antiporter-like MFS transporter
MAQVYGWLFSSNIPAALSPMLAGWAFDRTGSFVLPFALVALGLLLALAMIPRQVNGASGGALPASAA